MDDFDEIAQAVRNSVDRIPLGDRQTDLAGVYRSAARRRRGKVASVAAIFALLVAGAGVAFAIDHDGQVNSAVPALATPDGSPPGAGVINRFRDPAPPGWRTEQYGDVVMEVPAGWRYDPGIQRDWCFTKVRTPSEGYVALGHSFQVVWMTCRTPIAADLITEHVELSLTSSAPAPITQVPGLNAAQRVIGNTTITAYAKDASVLEHMMRSLRAADASSACVPRLGVDRPTSDQGQPEDGAVCIYYGWTDGQNTQRPLGARALVSKEQTSAIMAAVQSAGTAQRCPAGKVVSEGPVTVMRWSSGTDVAEIRFTAMGCQGSSGKNSVEAVTFVDDGTTLRTATPLLCSLLDTALPSVKEKPCHRN